MTPFQRALKLVFADDLKPHLDDINQVIDRVRQQLQTEGRSVALRELYYPLSRLASAVFSWTFFNFNLEDAAEVGAPVNRIHLRGLDLVAVVALGDDQGGEEIATEIAQMIVMDYA